MKKFFVSCGLFVALTTYLTAGNAMSRYQPGREQLVRIFPRFKALVLQQLVLRQLIGSPARRTLVQELRGYGLELLMAAEAAVQKLSPQATPMECHRFAVFLRGLPTLIARMLPIMTEAFQEAWPEGSLSSYMDFIEGCNRLQTGDADNIHIWVKMFKEFWPNGSASGFCLFACARRAPHALDAPAVRQGIVMFKEFWPDGSAGDFYIFASALHALDAHAVRQGIVMFKEFWPEESAAMFTPFAQGVSDLPHLDAATVTRMIKQFKESWPEGNVAMFAEFAKGLSCFMPLSGDKIRRVTEAFKKLCPEGSVAMFAQFTQGLGHLPHRDLDTIRRVVDTVKRFWPEADAHLFAELAGAWKDVGIQDTADIEALGAAFAQLHPGIEIAAGVEMLRRFSVEGYRGIEPVLSALRTHRPPSTSQTAPAA